MTELLKRAFDEASKLSADEQDALASELLQDLKGEHRWDTALESSQDELRSLADEALKEHRTGRTQPLDPDAL